MSSDTVREFEISDEQRILFNAGHGPPIQPTITEDLRHGTLPESVSNAQKNNGEGVYHPGSLGAGLRLYDDQGRLVTTQGIGAPYLVISGFYGNGCHHPEPSSSDTSSSSRKALKDKEEEQNWRLNHQPRIANANNNQMDFLVKQNEYLQRELTLKLEENGDLRKKFHHLTERLNELPNVSQESYGASRLINLTTTNEMGSNDHMVERQLEEEDDMMKSVQCSEHTRSIEETCGIEWNDVKGEFGDERIHQKIVGGGVSSSSSFEVVSPGFCADPTPERRHQEQESKDVDDEKTCKDLKLAIKELEAQIKKLGTRLEAEKLERTEADSKISRKLDEIQANAPQGAQSRCENALAFGINSQDCCLEMPGLTQMVSELKAAKWKLTEQTKELIRENEELKRMEQEWKSGVSMKDFKKLDEELQKQSKRAYEMESQLTIEQQCLSKAEAKVLELESKNTLNQRGTESSEALEMENSLLKHQIETYKEDFEVERRDREKIVSERDTFRRYFETLRSDLDVARHQLRKYEDDIYSLRADNNTLRTKLRNVSEELEGLKDLQNSKITSPNAGPDHTMKTKSAATQNTFIQATSTPLAGPSGEWKCRACTFSNPAPRSFCEMCGTQNEQQSSSASSRSSAGACAQNGSTNRSPEMHWNMPPLLSNLVNFGDIETD